MKKFPTRWTAPLVGCLVLGLAAGVQAGQSKSAPAPAPAKPAARGGAVAAQSIQPHPIADSFRALAGVFHPRQVQQRPSQPVNVGYKPAPAARIFVPVATRINQCTGARQAGPCAVWGRFRAAPDQNRLYQARRRTLMLGVATSSSWYGSDGVVRSITVTTSQPENLSVVMLPVTAGAAEWGGVGAGPREQSVDLIEPPGGGSFAGQNVGAAQDDSTARYGGWSGTGGGAAGGTGQETTVADPGNSATNPAAGSPGSTGSTGGTVQAPVSSSVAKTRPCRRVMTQANVGGITDNTTEVWCRDDLGDWAPAVPSDSSDGGAIMNAR